MTRPRSVSLRPTPRLLLSIVLAAFLLVTVSYLRPEAPLSPEVRAPGHLRPSHPDGNQGTSGNDSGSSRKHDQLSGTGMGLPEKMLNGGVISSKLGNETIKAELGRSTWRFLHTMMAQYPDEPSLEEQETLRSFIYLFARLYPCGECAAHFQEHLAKYPPQVSSRSAAAGWLCFIHNEVNKMLKKDEFDCNKIGDFYDCGCGHDEAARASGREDMKQSGKTVPEDEGIFEPTRVEITDDPPTNG
ncbi:hypothetical protein VTO42DRAFT_5419 [Malbranchea cinnamomea]